ncbi:MAG: GTP cyclohydrolase [Flavobacteriaceae bacterium]|nr:GTP cyclohydrolase [Flavobacteriaceae bacterium]
MTIEVRKVETKKDLKAFVKFPFSLYKDSKYWVPPVIMDEMDTLNKDKNPVFDNAEAHYFLAFKGPEIVGRIAAIINRFETEKQQLKKMRFGWFDTIDDIEVSKALMAKVEEIGKQNKLEFIEGPMGFSNLDKVGVLTEGYDSIGNMATWYNYPYYVEHLKHLGFQPEKVYVESLFLVSELKNLRFQKAYDLIIERYGYKPVSFTKTKDLLPYLDKMFDLFDDAYQKLSTYVPINQKQRDYYKKKFISFVNPEYIKFVLNADDEMIAFAVVLPSFSRTLQEIKGKLFPFGIFKLLKAKNNPDSLLFYLIGVHPKYQKKGVTAVIFNEFFKVVLKDKIDTCIRTPELENNLAEQQIWKDFNAKITKRRKTYKKDIV